MDEQVVEVHIYGRVQGVNYRAATCAAARSLGLRGWVRNEPDGSVRARAAGSAASVAALVAWCRHGPPAARVARVDTFPVVLTDTLPASFIVVRD